MSYNVYLHERVEKYIMIHNIFSDRNIFNLPSVAKPVNLFI